MWLRGPAGVGKTTLAQSIAETLFGSGDLGASFFWSGTAPNRPSSTNRFVPTIVLQFCKVIPGLTEHVGSALKRDPDLLDRTLAEQMDRLVVEPLNLILSSNNPPPGCYWLLLLDGLDECTGAQSHDKIVTILAQTLKRLSFPLRIIVFSRNEYEIRESIDRHFVESKSELKILELDDNTPQAREDVEKLITARLLAIKSRHPAARTLQSKGWPTAEDRTALVEKVAGLFVYADVTLKYIESPKFDPPTRLRKVLEFPFSGLDTMYALILKGIPKENVKNIQSILSWVIFGQDSKKSLSQCDKLFDHPGQGIIFVQDLSPIVHIPSGDSDSFSFFHESFADLLTDFPRLQKQGLEDFYCDVSWAHAYLATRWVNFYAKHGNDIRLDVAYASEGANSCILVSSKMYMHY